MRVFIANFGVANSLWPVCRERRIIATINDADLQRYWEAGDRAGYVEYAIASVRTVRGDIPTRPVASRWYSLTDVIAQTEGDLWIHREHDEIWWTTSGDGPYVVAPMDRPDKSLGGRPGFLVSKPCDAWSDQSRKGARLTWSALHPRAREFLFTEGTLQQLQPANAEYAKALVDGADLSAWHAQDLWKAKAAKSGRTEATIFDARQRAVWRMVETVKQIVAQANGQQVLRTLKSKECMFTEEELSAYVDALIKEQDGCCALTSLPLQYDGAHDDAQMLCSLDRIDSSRHYEADNLQVVCRFVNRWKQDTPDPEFRRLLGLVRRQQVGAED